MHKTTALSSECAQYNTITQRAVYTKHWNVYCNNFPYLLRNKETLGAMMWAGFNWLRILFNWGRGGVVSTVMNLRVP
jgi:hypothetical protein